MPSRSASVGKNAWAALFRTARTDGHSFTRSPRLRLDHHLGPVSALHGWSCSLLMTRVVARLDEPQGSPADYRDMVLLHKAVWPHGFAYQVFASPEKAHQLLANVLHLWGNRMARTSFRTSACTARSDCEKQMSAHLHGTFVKGCYRCDLSGTR